jgi:hypothetical protein
MLAGYGFLTLFIYNATFANADYNATVTCGYPTDTFNLSCVLPAWMSDKTDTSVSLKRMLPSGSNITNVHGSIPFRFFQQIRELSPPGAGSGQSRVSVDLDVPQKSVTCIYVCMHYMYCDVVPGM